MNVSKKIFSCLLRLEAAKRETFKQVKSCRERGEGGERGRYENGERKKIERGELAMKDKGERERI
jgi:hypothetical protein